ncbi:MAG: phage terminase large subunit [Sneathiellales bacterium]|nr:phage terminase large subunit [Sneathiellales bacterium]
MRALRPQPGPQETFLASAADIAIYGGAAGGGKSFSLLLEPLRHIHNSQFRAVIFRRTSKQIRNEGGLWDAARQIYGPLGGQAKETDLLWRFDQGGTVSFGSMEHEKNRFDWQGTEITLLGFDELTHFTEKQFFYLLSRNRSVSGVAPYIRATCNPDADSWVANLVKWWIDPDTGYPIKSRSGVVRWFVRIENELIWASSEENLIKKYPEHRPKSFTFIASSIEDNRILMDRDPGYRANLLALDKVERERLLQGNWKIRPEGGQYFRSVWFPHRTTGLQASRTVRGWDLAASAGRSADWTVGVRLSLLENGQYRVDHVERFRGSPAEVEERIAMTAAQDGPQVEIALPQDPGQAGKAQAQHLIRRLGGFRVRAKPVTGSKITRAAAISAQAEVGNLYVTDGLWKAAFLEELEAFPEGKNDDQVDALSEAFHALLDNRCTSQGEMYS